MLVLKKTPLRVRKCPTLGPLIRPFSVVVLTGRMTVPIFGSPGARDRRYRLPDSLSESEIASLKRAEVMALMPMAYRHRVGVGEQSTIARSLRPKCDVVADVEVAGCALQLLSQ